MVTYAIHRGEPVQRMADDAKTAIKTIIGPPDGHKEA
jgi:hypothetical protein